MTTDNASEAVSTEEQEAQQAEQEFSDGFDSVESSTDQRKPEAKQAEDVPADKPEEGEQAPEADDKPLFAGVTEDQLKSLLAKASEVDEIKRELAMTRDRLAGRFGPIQEAINELKQSAPGAKPGARFTAEKFKRLSQDYPELAEAIAADLSESLSVDQEQQGNSAQIDFDNVSRDIEARISRAVEERFVDAEFPTWREDTATPEFQLFKASLPEEDQAKLSTTWDSRYIRSKLKQFDAWKARAVERQQVRPDPKKRLQQAIQPRGSSTTEHVLSDEDAFAEGFNSVERTRL